MTHADLCQIAVRWMLRPFSRGGHGCQVALAETRSGWTGEIPDAIGFRSVSGEMGGDGCTLVECKTSRSDFLRDRAKPHRAEGKGLGHWRYYMCPTDLIRPDEVPPGWGLLYVNKRGSVEIVQGGTINFEKDSPARVRENLRFWRQPSDYEAELFVLVHLLQRLGNVERLNRRYKDCEARARRSGRNADRLREQLRGHGINPIC